MNITRIDHVSFTVADVDRSAAFYEKWFGFVLFKRYFNSGPETDQGTDTPNADMNLVWLRRPDERVMLELVQYLNHPSGPALHNSRVGAAHLCFTVDDLPETYESLLAAGVPFVSAPHQDQFGVRWVYLRDPDGNTVELLQDAPAAVQT